MRKTSSKIKSTHLEVTPADFEILKHLLDNFAPALELGLPIPYGHWNRTDTGKVKNLYGLLCEIYIGTDRHPDQEHFLDHVFE